MNNTHFFAFNNATLCVMDKNTALSKSQKNGRTSIKSQILKKPLIMNKTKPFVRGLELFFKGLFLYIKTFISITKSKKKRNITEIFGYIFLTLIALGTLFIVIDVLPYKIIQLAKFNQTNLLIKILMAVVKIAIFYFAIYLLRYLPFFAQIFRMNGSANIVLNNYEKVKTEKDMFRPTNFINFIVFSFAIALFMLSLFGFTIDKWYKFFIDCALIIISISISYEICIWAELQNGKIKYIIMPSNYLVCLTPAITEIIVSQTSLSEVQMMNENLNRDIFDSELISQDNIGISFVLAEVKEKLKKIGIIDKSEAEWLVANVLDKNRAEIKLISTITKEDYKKIKEVTARRLKNEPLTKIFGFAEFYGRRFIVNENVLSPRFETEILVEQCLKLLKEKPNAKVLDLCCGSGIIGITMKLEMPTLNVDISDISKSALTVAKQNANKLKAKVNMIESDLFDEIKNKYDLIVSNPPYIKTADIDNLDPEVKMFDPIISLDGGDDGFDFYKKIIQKSKSNLTKKGVLALEIGKGQAKTIKNLLQKDYENIKIIKDYNKIERVIISTKKEKQ